MTENGRLDTEDDIEPIAPKRLHEPIESGEEVHILDVRSEDAFEEWHIEGENVELVNYPYFQLLDELPRDLLEALPKDREITVLCAKGNSSEMLRQDMQCEGLLECFHNLKEIDKDVFRLLNKPDEPLTVDEITREMQRLLNDWYAQMGQLIGEFSDKYRDAPEQIPTIEN